MADKTMTRPERERLARWALRHLPEALAESHYTHKDAAREMDVSEGSILNWTKRRTMPREEKDVLALLEFSRRHLGRTPAKCEESPCALCRKAKATAREAAKKPA